MSDRVKIVTGGLATQLAYYVGGKIEGDPLWTARYSATNPFAVVQAHLDHLNAGADIIFANTYQASVEGFMQYLNLNYDESVELIKTCVKLAHIARGKFLHQEKYGKGQEVPQIFASIGPYGAHLHDGSEYTGSYAAKISPATIKKWHKARIDACVEAGVDGLTIETIPCQMEAEAVVDLILDEYPNLKFWVSFQCKDSKSLASGEDFALAAESICRRVDARGNNNLIAVGVNCLSPAFVTKLLKSIRVNVPLVAYPNSGEVYNVECGWEGKECHKPLEDFIEEWINLGVKIVGGCCRINANDIAIIKQKIESLRS